jgi:4-diphosphocytidyl-2-C-methyl-D-erythritol kinase
MIEGFAADTFDFGQNNLQPVAEKLCPEITQAIEWFASQGLNARMTGSGSSVFAAASQDVDWRTAPLGSIFRQCDNLDLHPLAGWASSDR